MSAISDRARTAGKNLARAAVQSCRGCPCSAFRVRDEPHRCWFIIRVEITIAALFFAKSAVVGQKCGSLVNQRGCSRSEVIALQVVEGNPNGGGGVVCGHR